MILKEFGLAVVAAAKFAPRLATVPAGATLYFCQGCEGVTIQGADMTGRIDTTKSVTVRISQAAMVNIQKGLFFWRASNAARFEVFPTVPQLPELGKVVAVLSGEITRGNSHIKSGSIIQGWSEKYFVPPGTVLINI